MPEVGHESLRNWVEGDLTLLTLALLLCGAGAVFGFWRQRNRPVRRVAVEGRSFWSRWIFRWRALRIQHFQKISARVMLDSIEALQSSATLGKVENYEARTMLPLVSEARKFGERLLAERRKRHLLLARRLEAQIELTIYELLEIENRLRSIPRAYVTLEDVVAGRFE